MDVRHDISAFILAGGRSTRMGQDKAFLQLNGGTLLERAIETARAVAPVVRIVGQKEKFAKYGDVVEDTFEQRGPLGGIHAALRGSSSELNLILAVDTPFVQPSALEFLIDVAANSTKMVTVPRVNGFFQTLCAVYRRAFADLAEKSLNVGRNKIDPLFTPEVARIVTESEMQALAIDPAMFDNLNTPEEFEKAHAHRMTRQPRHEH
jgi:molybdopterin-guanine dinucleotide biosynthesis protein A